MNMRIALVAVITAAVACQSSSNGDTEATGSVEYLSPEGLHRNPAFSQVVRVEGAHRTVYVGGQNAVDASGNLIGPGDLRLQAEQVATNIETALAAAGAGIEHIVSLTVYVVEGQPPGPAFQVFQQRWGESEAPPTISVLTVSGLAHPHFLLEIAAVAVVLL